MSILGKNNVLSRVLLSNLSEEELYKTYFEGDCWSLQEFSALMAGITPDKLEEFTSGSTGVLTKGDIKKIKHALRIQKEFLGSAKKDFNEKSLAINDALAMSPWKFIRWVAMNQAPFSLQHGEWSSSSYNIKPILTGYATIRPVPAYAQLLPFLCLNKAIATIGFTVKRRTWDNRDSRIYRYNRQFLENLFEASL